MRVDILDYLRFFAASAVVAYHFLSRPSWEPFNYVTSITNYGFLGVPLFFLISGFVIAFSAENRTAKAFFISRVSRIYPALWLGIVLTTTIVLLTDFKPLTFIQIITNFLLINRLFDHTFVDGVYWTLVEELRFYFCVWALLLFNIYQRYRLWIGAWLVLVCVHQAFEQPFFLGWIISPSYSPFFLAGIAIYQLKKGHDNVFFCSVVAISSCLAYFNTYTVTSTFIANATPEQQMNAGAISVILILLVAFLCVTRASHLKLPFAFTLGAITYPLYLLHNVAGKALIDYLLPLLDRGVTISIVVVLVFIASYFFYYKLEKPLSSLTRDFLKRLLRSS